MRIRTTIVFVCMCLAQMVVAQNWDYIRTSGEYYYGVGTAETESEADNAALANLTGQIVTHVSSDFMQIDDVTNCNGNIDHKTRVQNCVNTYSQSTLTNTERWVVGKEPRVTVRRYLKRSELARIFDDRIVRAKGMIATADEALRKGMVDIALQYYYWAYSFIRSVQFPNEVKGDDGRILIDYIPLKIDEILSDICVGFDSKDGERVNMQFTYKDKPVSSLEFTYSDGRAECGATARDGKGTLEMVSGYETDCYHLDIDYINKSQAHGDTELESVLNVITPKTFNKAHHVVECKKYEKSGGAENGGAKVSSDSTAVVFAEQAQIMNKVIEAIEKRNSLEVSKYLTIDGLNVYRQLIGRGDARVVDKENITFAKRANGRTAVRGLQMSFTFTKGRKQTIVDEVVFTFNPDNKIENIAFGLGKVAEDDILNNKAARLKDETRELLLEFMENYKTAYNLMRIDYIRSIFADDAVIIVGNVVKKKVLSHNDVERPVSLEGQNVIKYNRYTKDQYLNNLEKCMARNEYINLRFTNNDVQGLEKFENEELVAIQIGQEYTSSTYADMGYLFLLIDMTNHDEPLIKIRTWQPNEVDMDKVYHAGYFYNE